VRAEQVAETAWTRVTDDQQNNKQLVIMLRDL